MRSEKIKFPKKAKIGDRFSAPDGSKWLLEDRYEADHEVIYSWRRIGGIT